MPIKFSNSRYARFFALPTVRNEGMKKIRKARAMVVGTGGLGSVSTIMLTTLGIGYLRLIDKDKVKLTNLQRQLLFREKDLGLPKVVAAKKFLTELNTDVEIDFLQEELSEKNVSLAIEDVDFVVDALDNFKPRLILNKACYQKNIPFLFGAVSGLTGYTMSITRGSTCLECVFGHVKDELLPPTTQTGIHPSIIQIIGNLQVAEATKIMLGEKLSLVNRLLFCDLGTMEFEFLQVKKNLECKCSQY